MVGPIRNIAQHVTPLINSLNPKWGMDPKTTAFIQYLERNILATGLSAIEEDDVNHEKGMIDLYVDDQDLMINLKTMKDEIKALMVALPADVKIVIHFDGGLKKTVAAASFKNDATYLNFFGLKDADLGIEVAQPKAGGKVADARGRKYFSGNLKGGLSYRNGTDIGFNAGASFSKSIIGCTNHGENKDNSLVLKLGVAVTDPIAGTGHREGFISDGDDVTNPKAQTNFISNLIGALYLGNENQHAVITTAGLSVNSNASVGNGMSGAMTGAKVYYSYAATNTITLGLMESLGLSGSPMIQEGVFYYMDDTAKEKKKHGNLVNSGEVSFKWKPKDEKDNEKGSLGLYAHYALNSDTGAYMGGTGLDASLKVTDKTTLGAGAFIEGGNDSANDFTSWGANANANYKLSNHWNFGLNSSFAHTETSLLMASIFSGESFDAFENSGNIYVTDETYNNAAVSSEKWIEQYKSFSADATAEIVWNVFGKGSWLKMKASASYVYGGLAQSLGMGDHYFKAGTGFVINF